MILSWGKPGQYVRKLSNSETNSNPWIEFYPAVDGSTTLTPTKGEKKEAKVEGGDVEAVKYGRNTYALETQMRKGNDNGTLRRPLFDDNDGLVEGEYEYMLVPENGAAEGIHIEKCILTVEDSYTAADGAMWKITVDAVKPASGNTVKFGTVSVTRGADKKISAITFSENKAEA